MFPSNWQKNEEDAFSWDGLLWIWSLHDFNQMVYKVIKSLGVKYHYVNYNSEYINFLSMATEP